MSLQLSLSSFSPMQHEKIRTWCCCIWCYFCLFIFKEQRKVERWVEDSSLLFMVKLIMLQVEKGEKKSWQKVRAMLKYSTLRNYTCPCTLLCSVVLSRWLMVEDIIFHSILYGQTSPSSWREEKNFISLEISSKIFISSSSFASRFPQNRSQLLQARKERDQWQSHFVCHSNLAPAIFMSLKSTIDNELSIKRRKEENCKNENFTRRSALIWMGKRERVLCATTVQPGGVEKSFCWTTLARKLPSGKESAEIVDGKMLTRKWEKVWKVRKKLVKIELYELFCFLLLSCTIPACYQCCESGELWFQTILSRRDVGNLKNLLLQRKLWFLILNLKREVSTEREFKKLLKKYLSIQNC